jgi:hypothetical protein
MPRTPLTPEEKIRFGGTRPLPKDHPVRQEIAKNNIRSGATSPLPRNHEARAKTPEAPVQTDPPVPDVVGHAASKEAGFSGPQPKSFGSTVQPHASRVWKGAGEVVNKGSGPVLWIFAACVVIMFMANKNGAKINLERAMVGGFFVALILMAVHAKAPGLATAFAALILIEVLITYSALAFKNFSKIGSGTQTVPQIASTGSTAGAAAGLAGTYLLLKNAGSALSGLGNLFNGGSSAPTTTEEESKPSSAEGEAGEAASEGEGTLGSILGEGESILRAEATAGA